MNSHAEIRIALEQRLAGLQQRLEKVEAHRRREGGLPEDWPDRAAAMANDEVLDALNQSERSEVAALCSALRRLDEGHYGLCERCGVDIPPGRLRALPFATTCTGCTA